MNNVLRYCINALHCSCIVACSAIYADAYNYFYEIFSQCETGNQRYSSVKLAASSDKPNDLPSLRVELLVGKGKSAMSILLYSQVSNYYCVIMLCRVY